MINLKNNRLHILWMTFLCLATLFPPYQWGNELMTSDSARTSAQNLLPIKSYSFLFGDSQKEFKLNISGRLIPITLHRQLDTAELVLEYVLSLFASIIILFAFDKYKKVNGA